MLIMMTSAVHTSIHAMSPLFGVGAGVAVAEAASATGAAAWAMTAGLSAALSCAYAVTPKAENVQNIARMANSFFMVLSL
jgi:hypothetical protein